jgi:hypothetical protein
MQKRFIPPEGQPSVDLADTWLNLEQLADVEVTSEQPAAPIESALLPGGNPGWRASQPGKQTIRLRFAAPQPIRLIQLLFVEEAAQRVQEFVLRWLPTEGRDYQEIVRQQYVFSPPGTTREAEKYTVNLKDATALELSIVPDLNDSTALASLRELRLA